MKKKPGSSALAASLLLVLALFGAATLSHSGTASNVRVEAGKEAREIPPQSKRGVTGAVYVNNNAATGNAISVYRRKSDGTLVRDQEYETGGLGTGGLLDAQGSLILSEGHEWLFAVNALSNEISVFEVLGDGDLILVETVPSGGERPISLTVNEDLLYVLNSGNIGNVTAFNVGPQGHLTPLPGSTRPLSTPVASSCTQQSDAGRLCNVNIPIQVQFRPGGEVLVVTELLSGRILTYTIAGDGLASLPLIYQTFPGSAPFGFDFAERGRLIVSNAFFDAPQQGAASSYFVSAEGGLVTKTPRAGNGQAATCWVVVTNSGRHAIVSNTDVSTLSTYNILDDGTITLLNPVAAALPGADPRDMDLSDDGRFLYVLNNIAAKVSAFEVRGDGALRLIDEDAAEGFPPGAVGLASF